MAGLHSTTSANPPRKQNAATRSPTANPLAAGAERTRPATSGPGTKGSSGEIWYCPRVRSTSGSRCLPRDVDDHAPAVRVGEVDHLDAVGSVESSHLGCAHDHIV